MHKVLIVDDEKMIVNSLVLGFPWKEHGFEVIAAATSGREAQELIEGLHPDVVFTDIKMPGMSGLELMSRCKGSGAVFVVISGYAEFSFAQKALDLGATAYCLKPLENDEIAAALAKARQLIDHSDELRHAALLRFLNDPSEASAEALLSPMSGAAAIGLSRGDALPLLAGALPCHSFSFDDSCRLYVFPQEHAYLESYAFRAALLTALTSGALTAFVYDETDDASAYLRTHLNDLMDQLYAGFFAEKQAAIGRAQPLAPRDTAWLTELAALCNKNRPNEVLRALDALPAEHVVMSDALRIHNLCEALLCRLSNTPSAPGLRYGYELAARYATFAQMLDALRGRLQRSVGPAVDPDRLHNETLARIVRELNRDFMKDVSFQELCGRFCINPSYLSQLFKKELDVTFTSYLNRLRIGYAKELLESTTILVSEISDRVGYDNYLNFTKLFKRETGMTPKQYRAQSQGISGAER
ncbi:MAG: response regulator [Eubacteriales bacterium]|nr:response regulator [Eubacteriales bacterium]